MKKSLLWALIIIMSFSMVAALSLGGCKTTEEAAEVEEEAAEVEEEAAEVEEEAAEVEKPTLTFWMNPASGPAFHNLFDRFQEDTGYKLDIIPIPNPFSETVLTKWASGMRPDIMDFHMTGNWFPLINAAENCIDLSDLSFAKNTKFDALTGVTGENGEIWGPIINPPAIFAFYYNKKIFEELSLEIPKNFEEYYNLCGEIKEAGRTPLYAAGETIWQLQCSAYALSAGAIKEDSDFYNDINTGKKDFSQPAMLDALNAVQSLIDAGYYQDNYLAGNYEGLQEALFNGDVAMAVTGTWMMPTMADKYGLEELNERIGSFGLSMESNCVSFTLNGPGGTYVVPKTGDAEKEKGGIEFIRYVTEDGYQEFIDELNCISMIEPYETPEFVRLPDTQLMEYYKKDSGTNFGVYLKASFGSFDVLMQEMFAGVKTPEDVAKALSDEFAKNAKAAGLEGW